MFKTKPNAGGDKPKGPAGQQFTVDDSKNHHDAEATSQENSKYLEEWRQVAQKTCKAHLINVVLGTALNVAFYILYLVEYDFPKYTFPPIGEGHGVHLQSILLDLFELWACIMLLLSLNERKVHAHPAGAMPPAIIWLFVSGQSVWLKWGLIHAVEPYRTTLSYFMACTTLDLAVFCGVITVYTLALYEQRHCLSNRVHFKSPPTQVLKEEEHHSLHEKSKSRTLHV